MKEDNDITDIKCTICGQGFLFDTGTICTDCEIELKRDLEREQFTEKLSQIDKRVTVNEERFNKYMDVEEEHYEEYKYFEKRTVNFQEEFPYDQMNWLGKLIMWFICKRKK